MAKETNTRQRANATGLTDNNSNVEKYSPCPTGRSLLFLSATLRQSSVDASENDPAAAARLSQGRAEAQMRFLHHAKDCPACDDALEGISPSADSEFPQKRLRLVPRHQQSHNLNREWSGSAWRRA